MQGAARGGIPRRPGQFESGDDHDGSGYRGSDLHRADDRREHRADHRGGAPRRAAADVGRPDRPQPGRGPVRERCPSALRRGPDRGPTRGDQQGRGSRPVPRGDATHRSQAAALGLRPFSRGCAPDLGGHEAAGHHPPQLYAGRHRSQCRLSRRRVRSSGRVGTAPVAARRVLDRGERSRLEGIRARGDARRGGQRRDHLLDRELRCDGRSYR